MFYIVIGAFPEAYWNYLQTGKDAERAFGQLDEYGPFDITHTDDFEAMCTICVALILHVERLCASGR